MSVDNEDRCNEKNFEHKNNEIQVFKIKGCFCYACSESFETYSEYSKHLNDCVKNNESIEDSRLGVFREVRNEQILKCHICKKTFSNLKNRNEHFATHMKCHLCEKKLPKFFNSIQDLRVHMKRIHDTFPCYECHLNFMKLSDLKEHISNQHKEIEETFIKLNDAVLDILKKIPSIPKPEDFEELILCKYPIFATKTDDIWRINLKQILSKMPRVLTKPRSILNLKVIK